MDYHELLLELFTNMYILQKTFTPLTRVFLYYKKIITPTKEDLDSFLYSTFSGCEEKKQLFST